MKRWIKVLLRLLVSFGVLYFVISKISLQSMWQELHGFPGWLWCLAFFVFLVVQLISAMRWKILCRSLGIEANLLFFYAYYLMGGFFSMFLPGSITGDAIKGYLLARKGFGKTAIAYSILGDRVFGLVAIVIMCVATIPVYYEVLPQRLASGLFIAGCAVVTGFATFPLWASDLTAFLTRKIRFFAGPDFLRFWNLKTFLGALGLSLVLQSGNCAIFYILARGLDISVGISFYFFAVPLVAILTSLPVSMQGVGIREGSLMWIMGLCGVTAEKSIVLGLLSYSVSLATGLLGGFVYLLTYVRIAKNHSLNG